MLYILFAVHAVRVVHAVHDVHAVLVHFVHAVRAVLDVRVVQASVNDKFDAVQKKKCLKSGRYSGTVLN